MLGHCFVFAYRCVMVVYRFVLLFGVVHLFILLLPGVVVHVFVLFFFCLGSFQNQKLAAFMAHQIPRGWLLGLVG